jgi:hypothetical protein
VRVGVVQVEALVGDDQRVCLLRRPLHLLLGVAPRVRAPVVAPARKMQAFSSCHVINSTPTLLP